jgi:tRNA (guanine-N7-)-methyltransferase
MLEATLAEPRLVWQAERANDWRLAPEDHIRTRYQAKAEREGRPAVFLRFLRDSSAAFSLPMRANPLALLGC